MAVNISGFKASFNDISRDNRFEIEGDGTPGNLNVLVQDAVLPGLSFHTADWRHIGYPQRYPYDIAYPDLQLSFIDTSNQDIQKFYVNWMGEIHEGGNFKYKKEYTKTITVHKLDRDNKRTMSYTFEDVFPTNMSDVALSTAGTNTATRLTITFDYNYWQAK